jgi:hypothetical protein
MHTCLDFLVLSDGDILAKKETRATGRRSGGLDGSFLLHEQGFSF